MLSPVALPAHEEGAVPPSDWESKSLPGPLQGTSAPQPIDQVTSLLEQRSAIHPGIQEMKRIVQGAAEVGSRQAMTLT